MRVLLIRRSASGRKGEATRSENPRPGWLIPVTGKAMLVVGWRPQVFSAWASPRAQLVPSTESHRGGFSGSGNTCDDLTSEVTPSLLPPCVGGGRNMHPLDRRRSMSRCKRKSEMGWPLPFGKYNLPKNLAPAEPWKPKRHGPFSR